MKAGGKYFKSNSTKQFISCIAIVVLSVTRMTGQTDTIRNFRNTIRYNITNPVLFDGKFIILGYERVINDRQSISMNIGRTALGGISFLSDSLSLKDQQNDRGFNFSIDYRFYLQKENKYHAPRGIYIGPYYAFNTFSRDLLWDLNTNTYNGQVSAGYKITGNLIGCQLGYQFVFWNRLSVDLVLMGPGFWAFKIKSHFYTNLLAEDEEMLLEQMNELLKEKLPNTSFVFTGTGMEAKKSYTTSMIGLRYMINIGFRF